MRKVTASRGGSHPSHTPFGYVSSPSMLRLTVTLPLVLVCAVFGASAAAQAPPDPIGPRIGVDVPTLFEGTTVLRFVPNDSLEVLGFSIPHQRLPSKRCADAEMDPGIFAPFGPNSDPDPKIVIKPLGNVDAGIVLLQPPGSDCWRDGQQPSISEK